MSTPLSRNEIATLLDCNGAFVEDLWAKGILRRSVENDSRPLEDLRHSDSYDVLEYLLTTGQLHVTLSKELAALWVANLAEVLEWKGIENAALSDITKILYDYALDDNLCEMDNYPDKTAYVCAAAFREIDRVSVSSIKNGSWSLANLIPNHAECPLQDDGINSMIV